ncbi:MAG TPA: hypothetical protein PLZ79_07345 [Burkholderiales bacterium]|nr:hypothetical protein [Burkholderiales bacterium]
MKAAALTHRSPVPAPQGPDLRSFLGRAIDWLLPVSEEDKRPATPKSPQEIEALERQIRKFTEELRFTGFPS